MRRWLFVLFAGGAVGLAGCSHAALPTQEAVVDARLVKIATYARSFRNAEGPILQSMTEHDSRMLARMSPKPSPAQYRLAGENETWLAGRSWYGRGFQDPFLLSERESDLDAAEETLESVELDADLGMRRELLAARGALDDDPMVKNLATDQHLLRRMIAEGRARIERERELPRGASDLFLATADAIPVDPSSEDWQKIDATIGWRVDQVRATLKPNELSEADRLDLVDSLAVLQGFGKKLPRTLALIDKLKAALDGLLVAPYPLDDEDTLEHEKAAFLGEIPPLDQLEPAFEGARAVLRGQIDAGLSVLDPGDVLKVKERALSLLFRPTACGPSLPAVTARALAPPRERAWACALVKATENGSGVLAELAALVALHDATIIGSWALATHTQVRDPQVATAHFRPILSFTNAEKKTLLTSAQARPLRAIGAGFAAVLLASRGGGEVKTTAARWRAFGDAPFDVVKVQLAARGR